MKEEDILDTPEIQKSNSINQPFRYGVISILILSLIKFLLKYLTLLISEPYLGFSQTLLLLFSASCVLYFFIFQTKLYHQNLIKLILPTSTVIFISFLGEYHFSGYLFYGRLPSVWNFDWLFYLRLMGSSLFWGWLYSFGILSWIRYSNRKWILILINIGWMGIYYWINF